jgi:hypothetical protein
MSELGTMANGWGADHPGPSTYVSALKDAELVVRRINAGTDEFNRRSFVNRGDLDGQWQFIETWDRKEKRLLTHYTPHPNTCFVLGLPSRFIATHSEVLACTAKGGRTDPWPRVFAAALRSPKRNLTLVVVNDGNAPCQASFELRGLTMDSTLYRYSVNETERDRNELKTIRRRNFGWRAPRRHSPTV